MKTYTPEEKVRMRYFLRLQHPNFNQEQWEQSYLSAKHGGRKWDALGGFTNCHQALTWYQWHHKPGSKEWRPSIIIKALYEASRDLVIPAELRAQMGL